MPQMDDGTLKAILAGAITGAVGEQGSSLIRARVRALQYYRGEPFGNETEGRSKVVSRDVAETIDQTMPSLMKIFMSGDQIGRFEPRLTYGMDAAAVQRREQQAEQATDYVNWIWSSLNDGYRTCYEWFHDALLQKNGIVKIWWDPTPHVTRERYVGLTDAELEQIAQDDSVDIAEATSRDDPDAAAAAMLGEIVTGLLPTGPDGQPLPLPQLHDVVIRRKNMEGRIRISAVPLDEFLVQHRTVQIEGAPFTCHRYAQSVSELTERFPDLADEIRNLPADEGEWNQERLERFRDEDAIPWRDTATLDNTRRLVWIAESFLKVDYDGDGISEMRAIVSAGGSQGTGLILSNEEIDDNPFASITPYIQPHMLWGRSIADQTEDLQLIKSTLLRGALDTIYNANSPQLAVQSGRVNLDDLLNRRSGGIVRTEGPPGEALMPVPTLNIAPDAYQLIALMDNVRETRTGIRRFSQGPGADALNNAYTDTATGANIVENSSQERIDLIARNFAETGMKRALRLILKLECEHRTEPRMIRLRDEWVPVDPREWDSEMDMTITVGLGTGNRQQQMQGIGFLLNIDKGIIQAQGGMNGPLVTWEHVYNKLAKAVEFLGLKSVASYYADPGNAPAPQQPPPPSPEAVKAQHQVEMAQQQAEIDRQNDAARLQADLAGQKAKAELELQLMQQRAVTEMTIARQKAQNDAELEMIKAQRQAADDERDAVLRQGMPPVPGARKAPDGKFYVPDQNRPGKFMMVV